MDEETEDETTSGGGWRSGGATSTSSGAGEGGSEDCLETFRVGLEAGGGGSDGGDNKESSAAIPYSRDMVILFVCFSRSLCSPEPAGAPDGVREEELPPPDMTKRFRNEVALSEDSLEGVLGLGSGLGLLAASGWFEKDGEGDGAWFCCCWWCFLPPPKADRNLSLAEEVLAPSEGCLPELSLRTIPVAPPVGVPPVGVWGCCCCCCCCGVVEAELPAERRTAAAAAPLAEPRLALSLLLPPPPDLSETSLGGPPPLMTPAPDATDIFSSSNSIGPAKIGGKTQIKHRNAFRRFGGI